MCGSLLSFNLLDVALHPEAILEALRLSCMPSCPYKKDTHHFTLLPPPSRFNVFFWFKVPFMIFDLVCIDRSVYFIVFWYLY